MQNQNSYYVLKVRTKVYNPREMEDMKDSFEVRDIRFETEHDALDYILTSNIKQSNIVSLEHRIVNTIDIHEKLRQGSFVVGVDGKNFAFHSKKDALVFLQSQTSDNVSLTSVSYEE